MKSVKCLLVALALTFLLAIYASAGDMHIGGSAPTPTPTPPPCEVTNTCSGDGGSGGNITPKSADTDSADTYLFLVAITALIRVLP